MASQAKQHEAASQGSVLTLSQTRARQILQSWLQPCSTRRVVLSHILSRHMMVIGAQPLSGCSPVVIRVLLSIAGLGRDGADDVLGVGAHQLHRVHSQVLVQVSTALSSIGAQVAFVFSLF